MVRRTMASGFAAALLLGAALAVVPAAHAGLPPVIDPGIPDGDPGSLRDVLENQIGPGDSVVLQAGATYTLDNCDQGDLDLAADVTIDGNGATILQTCEDRVIDTEYDLTLIGVTITGGRTDSDGGGIQADRGDDGQRITIVDSTVTDNIGCSEGGGLEVEGAAVVSIIRSTFSANGSWEESAIDMDDGGSLLVVNSTISGNSADAQGALYGEDGEGNGSITLVYSTVAGNVVAVPEYCESFDGKALATEAEDRGVSGAAEGDQPANIGLDGDDFALTTFGSVIALPNGGPNCTDGDAEANLGNTVSVGYNYSDDGSCGLDQPTDVQNGPDPLLGPLASNGGPTQTHLPQAGSPLIDAIPTADCAGGNTLAGSTITTDQRSLARPDVVNQQCDIGSVEVQTEQPAPDVVVLQPNFAG